MTGSDRPHDGPLLPDQVFVWLGLDPLTMNVYRQLLLRPDATLADLAQACSVSECEVRSALDALAGTALLRPSQSHADAWRPISPEVAMRRLVAEMEQEYAAQGARLTQLRDEVVAFVTEYREEREARLARMVERFDGRDAVVSIVEELSAGAREEILAMNTARPVRGAVEQAHELDHAALSRGIRVRSIHLEGLADKASMSALESLSRQGARVRLAPSLPVRMFIYDRKVAVIASDPENIQAGAIVLRGGGVLCALVALFEFQWEAAREPFGATASQPTGPSLMERQILKLLSRGQKDDAVAHHLGISVRTARRFIAELHERTGAGSRFELAIRAKDLGWL